MGLFHKKPVLEPLQIADDDIVAMADGKIVPVNTVSDEVFASEAMGKTCVFQYDGPFVTICAPANGELSALFPTGHAFGIAMHNGMELLIHIGVNTVNEKGSGFRVLAKQGDSVKAGTPVVEVNLKKLSGKYDMSTMLIVTDDAGHPVEFPSPGPVRRGASLVKK